MRKRHRFEIVFAPEVIEHLLAIEKKYHSLIEEGIDLQLSFTPGHPTRNRKMLKQPAPFGAAWELRFGPANKVRVFYEVDQEKHQVQILAIGIKERNHLFIGREEFGK